MTTDVQTHLFAHPRTDVNATMGVAADAASRTLTHPSKVANYV